MARRRICGRASNADGWPCLIVLSADDECFVDHSPWAHLQSQADAISAAWAPVDDQDDDDGDLVRVVSTHNDIVAAMDRARSTDDPDEMMELLDHPNEAVAREVADNERATPEVLAVAGRHPDWEVRWIVAGRPDAPETTRRLLLDDPVEHVRQRAKTLEVTK